MKKKILGIALVMGIAFAFTSCEETHYYHQHHQHSVGYYHRHPHRTPPPGLRIDVRP